MRCLRDKTKHTKTKCTSGKHNLLKLNREILYKLPQISSVFKPKVGKIGPLLIAKFLKQIVVDYPDLKRSSTYRKVLTMAMLVLFKLAINFVKVSFSPFKRFRPDIVLVS